MAEPVYGEMTGDDWRVAEYFGWKPGCDAAAIAQTIRAAADAADRSAEYAEGMDARQADKDRAHRYRLAAGRLLENPAGRS